MSLNPAYVALLIAYVCMAWAWWHKKTPLSKYSTEEILTEFYVRVGAKPLTNGEKCDLSVKGLPSKSAIRNLAVSFDFGRAVQRPVKISWPNETPADAIDVNHD